MKLALDKADGMDILQEPHGSCMARRTTRGRPPPSDFAGASRQNSKSWRAPTRTNIPYIAPPRHPWRFRGRRTRDRKSAVAGKSMSVRVALGGRRLIKKHNHMNF